MIDWKRVSIQKLIKKIEERMNFECILIKNALSSQTTEFKLAPAVAEYAIPSYIWNTWSDEIQNSALEAFLNGDKPFHLEFDVSNTGDTCHRKIIGAFARKSGEHSRNRKKIKLILIRKTEIQSTYLLLLLFAYFMLYTSTIFN